MSSNAFNQLAQELEEMEGLKMIERIEREAERMSRMVNSVKNFVPGLAFPTDEQRTILNASQNIKRLYK